MPNKKPVVDGDSHGDGSRGLSFKEGNSPLSPDLGQIEERVTIIKKPSFSQTLYPSQRKRSPSTLLHSSLKGEAWKQQK
jgi:hypothetical protein